MNWKKVMIVILCMLLIILTCFIMYKFLLKDDNTENLDYSQGASGDLIENLDYSQSTSGDLIENLDYPQGTSGDLIENYEDKFIIGEREAIFTEKNYPVIDGSTETIPLAEAFKAEFLGKNISEITVNHNKTHHAYENLIKGKADLILVTYPSEDELNLAKNNNVELEIIPVVNEGFVFFNSVDNPVKNLTLEQIQKIYTGEIKNWLEVGGFDAEIEAYQRPANSYNQTGMLNLVMNGLKMIEPKKENLYKDFDIVAYYKESKNSIGYSYYYYARTIYDIMGDDNAEKINLLAVDGVKPTNESIKNGSYPIRTNYYIVINKNEPKDGNVRKLVNAMLSERGQSAAEAIGYVGI